MKLSLIAIGILICLACLALLLTMDLNLEKPSLQTQTYTMGGDDGMKIYIIDNKKEDLFDSWKRKQVNQLEQEKWDAYMGEE